MKSARYYDLNTAAAQSLAAELGCPAAQKLQEVTKNSDVIITVVTDDKAMKKIFNGGLLSRSKGKLFINCATSLRRCTSGWKKKPKRPAPIAGSLHGLEHHPGAERTLYLMCGGKPEVFERAKPILEKLSDSMRYIGTAGKAAKVKALVNMVMNINTAGLAEGLGLGQCSGARSRDAARSVFQTGANSRVLQTDGEDMQNREHSCFFSAAHAAKDSGIALKLAKEQGLNLPLAAATEETIRPHGGRRSWRTGQIRHRRTDLQRPSSTGSQTGQTSPS